ncbi:AMP-binding protein [Tellurirhabdus bombi]|uniref:AMP-binding protein n=1 Tax=Tellurirhabdus bombi TaxID=2907205 RepID=UPI001F3E7137|nr:AMP-binding protein [Tellurirhabdus bombi]
MADQIEPNRLILDCQQPAKWPPAKTEYEQQALAFCQSWVAGQESFVLKTSGSTGTPKPISLNRQQMRASAQLTGLTFGLQAGDEALVCLNVQYIAGIMMLVRGMELGLRLTVVEPVAQPLEGLQNPVFDFAAFVPLQLQTILTQSPESRPILDRMKAILVGGAAVSPSLAEQLQTLKVPVYSTYGMTETVSHIAIRRVNGPEASDVFSVLNGVEVGVDERSCLHITAAATNFQRQQTNDVVELLEQKEDRFTAFRLIGRADSIINSGGVKIQPELIERVVADALTRSGDSRRLFIAGLPDERLGQRVVLVTEGPPLAEEAIRVIQEQTRSELGAYFVPKAVLAVPVFAETPTGKIDKKEILRILSQKEQEEA